ncbi:MAG: phosphoribosylanthranilate isomerase [bacterium]|nr:phosphoribosylanthranilate isomerase [Gammaproteobacteria bacterium]HIL95757.1 phosphoribosylanthranilate isomerase [Pseudomonadales bacterium]
MRTRVKICGITNNEDARFALDAGADALGFNQYQQSPRFVDPDQTRKLVSQLPPLVTSVGLFVNESAERVREICARVGFDLLQFSGDETDEYCRQFDLPYIKAIRVRDAQILEREIQCYPGSRGILLDAYVKNQFGGTGQVIDWQKLPVLNQKILLAGGLNPQNVSEAIAQIRPYGVDVSSGVEMSKGKKDPKKIQEFFKSVAAADRSS